MVSTAIVYNKYWTIDCISKLNKEKQEIADLYDILEKIKYSINSKFAYDLNKIICEVKELEDSISLTCSVMNKYMYDMDVAIDKISDKIRLAEETGKREF